MSKQWKGYSELNVQYLIIYFDFEIKLNEVMRWFMKDYFKIVFNRMISYSSIISPITIAVVSFSQVLFYGYLWILIYLSPLILHRVAGGWSQSQSTSGKRRGPPWTSCPVHHRADITSLNGHQYMVALHTALPQTTGWIK